MPDPTNQGELFDSPQEDALKPWQGAERKRIQESRNEAIARVEAHAEAAWKDAALEAIRKTATTRETFISDDVWAVGNLAQTREDRALGPVLLRASRLGWCVKTDRVRPSVRSHLSGKPVWRSLLWKGDV